jgi:hypothetical protein
MGIGLRADAHGKCCIAFAVETLNKAGAHACTLAGKWYSLQHV